MFNTCNLASCIDYITSEQNVCNINHIAELVTTPEFIRSVINLYRSQWMSILAVSMFYMYVLAIEWYIYFTMLCSGSIWVVYYFFYNANCVHTCVGGSVGIMFEYTIMHNFGLDKSTFFYQDCKRFSTKQLFIYVCMSEFIICQVSVYKYCLFNK